MILDRVYTPGLAQVAYLVADESAGEVAVIDPRRDVDEYLAWAEDRNLRITAILETHVHADFVSGARELAAATGAPIFASRLGGQDFPYVPLDDGQDVPVGRLRLRALWTPGHTPEHMSFLLIDPDQDPNPIALFSGDALFVGDVGRPDLLGAEQTEQLANQLYHTVVDRLSRLHDDVIVYPGHTAGSACGKKIGDAPNTTIGRERRDNYAFQARSKDDFVRMVLEGMPPAPTYYPVLKKVNKAGPALLADLSDGVALSPDEVAARQAAGALVIDARTPEGFGAGHVPGAVFAGLGPNFTTWLGWIAPYDREIVLVLDNDSDIEEARTELRRIGLDHLGGFLKGGMAAWHAADLPVSTLAQTSVTDLAQTLAGDPGDLIVLDVRSADEWEEGHIPGAVHHFAGELAQGETPPIDPATPVAVICGSGYRSTVAASLLARRGYRHLINVAGGMEAWNDANLATNDATPRAA